MLKNFIIGLGLFCVAAGLPQSVTHTSHTVETSESEGYSRSAAAIMPREYCPAGFRLENGRCISNQPQCEPGSVLINGMCYKQEVTTSNCNRCGGCATSSCPAGFQLVNGVCQQIQTPCTSNCVQPVLPPPPPPPPPQIQCPQCPPCIQQPCPACPPCPVPIRPDPIILPPAPQTCCNNPGSCNINPSPCQIASTLGNIYQRYKRSTKACQPEKN